MRGIAAGVSLCLDSPSMSRARAVLRSAILLSLIGALDDDVVADAKRKPPRRVCSSARLVLPDGDPPLVDGGTAGTPEILVLADTGAKPTVSTTSGCAPATAKLKGTRKGTT